MQKLKHRDEPSSTDIDEQRIREDERSRVMAELRGDRSGDDGPADDDWRTTPPAFGAPGVDDPRRATESDPRTWDVPDLRDTTSVGERTDRHNAILGQRPWAVEEQETVTEQGFSPGQILIILAGAAALFLGVVAVARTGLNRSFSRPVEEVFGWNHTALLGLIEVGAGAIMILSGLRASARWIGGLVGLAAIAGGALILGELDWTMDELGAERVYGWVAIVIGGVAVIGAAVPRVRRRARRMNHVEPAQLSMR